MDTGDLEGVIHHMPVDRTAHWEYRGGLRMDLTYHPQEFRPQLQAHC